MTDEVEVKDEADWAMDYANERARRMKAETRLASFMLDAPAFCVAVDQLIDSIFEPAARVGDSKGMLGHEFIEALVKTLKYSDDLGNNININIFDPVWPITDEEKQALKNSKCLEDIPRSYRKRVDEMIEAANNTMYEDWTEICQETHFMSPQQVDRKSEERMYDLLRSVEPKGKREK